MKTFAQERPVCGRWTRMEVFGKEEELGNIVLREPCGPRSLRWAVLADLRLDITKQGPARVGFWSSRSEKWIQKAFTLFREVQSEKKMLSLFFEKWKVKSKCFEIEKWNFSRILNISRETRFLNRFIRGYKQNQKQRLSVNSRTYWFCSGTHQKRKFDWSLSLIQSLSEIFQLKIMGSKYPVLSEIPSLEIQLGTKIEVRL